jgi:hypothetical protein
MEREIQTEQDLQQLIGQYESLRLEFKASGLLSEDTDRIIRQLTEEVSAFANTEGGTIIIGIREGKKSVASLVDEGTDPEQMPPERLEQIIASNISPPILGLTVRAIPLSGAKEGKVAYVVTVPKGSTAYQARKTRLYYGRSELSANALYDHEIRLLMERGRVPQARVDLYSCNLLTAQEELAVRKAELDIARGDFRRRSKLDSLKAPERDFDEYQVRLAVENVGEVTLRDFLLHLSFETDFPVFEMQSLVDGQTEKHTESGTVFRHRFAKGTKTSKTLGGGEYTPTEEKLFPGERIQFPQQSWFVDVPAGEVVSKPPARISWTIFLDDAPPVRGKLDITPRSIVDPAAVAAHRTV